MKKKSIKVSLGTVICIMVIELLIITLVAMYLYYNNNSNFDNSINNSENTSQIAESENKKINKVYEDKELIYSSYSKYSSEYSYSLPYININSADINKINQEIEEYYMPLINNELKNEQEGFSVTMYNIKYTSYLNDNILSLVISDYSPNDDIYYTVYNVDIYTGRKISNSELINLKNISESDYLNNLQTLCKEHFIAKYNSLEKSDFYEERYNKTISTDNCSIQTPIFLNKDGNISVIPCIYGLAGDYFLVIDTDM